MWVHVGGLLASTWQVHGKYMASIWQVHGKYKASTWQVHGKYMASIWQVYGEGRSGSFDGAGHLGSALIECLARAHKGAQPLSLRGAHLLQLPRRRLGRLLELAYAVAHPLHLCTAGCLLDARLAELISQARDQPLSARRLLARLVSVKSRLHQRQREPDGSGTSVRAEAGSHRSLRQAWGIHAQAGRASSGQGQSSPIALGLDSLR